MMGSGKCSKVFHETGMNVMIVIHHFGKYITQDIKYVLYQ